MDDDDVMDALPETYATLLRLRAAGADDSGIARALDVPVEAVASLLDLAQRKLRRLRAPP